MVKCSVRGCAATSEQDVTYFRFPTLRLLRRKWEKAIGTRSKPKMNSVVCSQHFLSSQYEKTRGRIKLKSGVVPSVFDVVRKNQNDLSTTTPPPTVDSRGSTNSIKTETEEVPNKENHKNDENNDKIDTKNDVSSDKCDTDNDKCEGNDKISNGPNENNEKCTIQSGHEEKERYLKNVSLVKKDNSSDSSNDAEKDLGAKELQNGEKRVQERLDNNSLGEKNKSTLNKNGDSKKKQSQKKNTSQNRCIESAPKLPDGPRDIDKEEEDIEALLTNYHIKQDKPLNIHSVTEHVVEPETIEIEIEPEKDPVFIEISVDKDNPTANASSDCLMVLESLEVELDPSELMLAERDLEPEPELETVEIEDAEPKDPISLLTSSDEDEVIIEEPHIDTVSLSSETDEDDLPLVKLLKRRREKKKKKEPVNKDDNADIAKVLWGMYEYYCVQCHFTTSSGIEYRKHTATHAKVLMMCQICGYMTASEQQFTKHEKQHGEKKYKCHLCPYKAKHNMSLLYHLKGHKAEDFISSASASNVMIVPVNKHKFECKLCDYSTKKRCDLRRHVSRRHKEEFDDDDYVP